MTEIQFEGEQEFPGRQAPERSTFVRLVLKTGIVQTKQAAEYVLLGIAIIAFAATFFIISGEHKTPQQAGPTEPEISKEIRLHAASPASLQ
jgi:hypothetical protein